MIDVTDVVIVILALSLLALVVLCGYAVVKDNKDGYCAFCKNQISENADTVYYADGRRYHVECWREYSEEDEYATE